MYCILNFLLCKTFSHIVRCTGANDDCWVSYLSAFFLILNLFWKTDEFLSFTVFSKMSSGAQISVISLGRKLFRLISSFKFWTNLEKMGESRTSDRILFHPWLPETWDATQTISWWGKIGLGRIHRPENHFLIFKLLIACSNLVDIHDTLDPHTNGHLKEIVIFYSYFHLDFNPWFKPCFMPEIWCIANSKSVNFCNKNASRQINIVYHSAFYPWHMYGMQKTIGQWKRHFC